jgi:hypothetical protein
MASMLGKSMNGQSICLTLTLLAFLAVASNQAKFSLVLPVATPMVASRRRWPSFPSCHSTHPARWSPVGRSTLESAKWRLTIGSWLRKCHEFNDCNHAWFYREWLDKPLKCHLPELWCISGNENHKKANPNVLPQDLRDNFVVRIAEGRRSMVASIYGIRSSYPGELSVFRQLLRYELDNDVRAFANSRSWLFSWLRSRENLERTHDNWPFDGGIVHALAIILQLRSDIACLIFFSRDAIWQRVYNSFMRYLLIITRNKLIAAHSIICEPLSLFAVVSLTLRLTIAGPWHECNRTPYGPDSEVHGIRSARDLMGIRRSVQLFQWNRCRDRVEIFVFFRLQSKVLYPWMTQTMRLMIWKIS